VNNVDVAPAGATSYSAAARGGGVQREQITDRQTDDRMIPIADHTV